MRRLVVAFLVVPLTVGFAPTASAATPTAEEASAADSILARINARRAKRGKPPLRANRYIENQAYDHSVRQADDRVISHKGVKKRYNRIDARLGISYFCENVALSFASTRAEAARELFQAWMRSTPHRRCMLDVGHTTDTAGVGVERRGRRWYATYIGVDN